MSRRGLALVTVFWWIAAASMVLTLSFTWTLQKERWGAKIQESKKHLYLAEGILAGELNRLKASDWASRWYHPAANASPGPFDASISGSFEGATYSGHVQDVLDPWGPNSPARVLPDHTDIFVRLQFPVPDAAPQVRCFFYRAVFRHPSAERPTAVLCRRFTEIGEFDPESAADRATVLVSINAAERERELNRPANRVLEREIRHLNARGVPFHLVARELSPRMAPAVPRPFLVTPAFAAASTDESQRERNRPSADVIERSLRDQEGRGTPAEGLWPWLLTASHLDEQIRYETGILADLREGQRLTVDLSALGTADRYGLARERFRSALTISRASQDQANAAYGTPQCLYAMGRGEWNYARTLRRVGPEGTERTSAMRAARAAFNEILQSYPWRDALDVGGGFPERLEAPHARAPIAFSMMDEADPEDPVTYNAAVDQAREVLEKIRQEYPYFHLWDEDAITGTTHAGPSTRSDETVWFLEQLLYLPVLSFGGFVHYSGVPAQALQIRSITRWVPEPAPAGTWIGVNAVASAYRGPGGAGYGCTVTQLKPRRGECMGSRFLIAGGYGDTADKPQIYDALTNAIRRTRGAMTVSRFEHRAHVLPDGRVLLAAGCSGGATTYVCFLDTAELFDPVTETFRLTSPMTEPRSNAAIAVLSDGRVLVAGGVRRANSYVPGMVASAEVYTPSTNSWSRVSNQLEELHLNGVTPVVLDDGSVLLAGRGESRITRTLQLYLPDKNCFWPGLNPPSTAADVAPWPATPIGEMRESRAYYRAIKLKDGRVLFVNGKFANGASNPPTLTTEIYDPATRTFTMAGTTQGTGGSRSATRLPDGKVLVTGGYNGAFVSDNDHSDDIADLFDPVASTWSIVAPLPVPVFGHELVRLAADP